MTKYGRPVSVAAVEHTRDIRMLHERQRLPLGFESGEDLLGVHAQLDDFKRHATANRLLLLRHVNDAAAALADLLEQFVTANAVAGFFGEWDGNDDGAFRSRSARKPRLRDAFGA